MSSAQDTTGLRATRTGRRPKFSKGHDLIIIRDVAAARAHLALNGATKERFDIAAKRSNATTKLSCTVTWKAVQDKYKRVQQGFDERDAVDQRMSGIGGEVDEMDELLMGMKEERADFRAHKDAVRKAVEAPEAEKERVGVLVCARAMSRSGRKVLDLIGTKGDGATEQTPRKRTPRKSGNSAAFSNLLDDDISTFTSALKASDEARNDLERKRLALDQARFDDSVANRAEERAERSRVELEKFKIMMEMFKGE